MGGSFRGGKAGRGPRLDGIGLLVAEEGGPIVLVALRIAARDTTVGGLGRVGVRREQPVQEVQQVVGILPGGIKPDDEVDGPVPLDDLLPPLAEAGVALGGFGKLQFRRGRRQVVAQEGRLVPIAGRVDADADAPGLVANGLWKGGVVEQHKTSPKRC